MANVKDQGPPSATAIAISTAIISGLTGYFLGQARSIGLFGKPSTNPSAKLNGHARDDESNTSDAEESGEDDVQDLGELKTFPGSSEECKLVLVVRTDLGMGKGMDRFSCSYQ